MMEKTFGLFLRLWTKLSDSQFNLLSNVFSRLAAVSNSFLVWMFYQSFRFYHIQLLYLWVWVRDRWLFRTSCFYLRSFWLKSFRTRSRFINSGNSNSYFYEGGKFGSTSLSLGGSRSFSTSLYCFKLNYLLYYLTCFISCVFF